MITYNSGTFGFQLLFRLHGSAVFKSITPALISSIIYIIIYHTHDLENDDGELFDHPYPMGALISALTFLLAFRANFSYNRYWEAMTAVHQMHSKWLDAGMELAAFHLQSAAYDARKPPAFGSHPELKHLERERERLHAHTIEELESQLNSMENIQHSVRDRIKSVFNRSSRKANRTGSTRTKTEEQQTSPAPPLPSKGGQTMNLNNTSKSITAAGKISKYKKPRNPFKPWSHSKKPTSLPKNSKVSSSKDGTNAWEADSPPLFLQESAHLLSLLSAVAMSTLRNDLEQVGSPLDTFYPGVDWPHVDPDAMDADVRKDWALTTHRSYTVCKYLTGLSRTPKSRTLYNAARPFRVVGGVSDAEIDLLQAARGPLAKVALCTMWLQEFISREYLHGSTGHVAPPIISRLYQYTSDGMAGYNQARKVAYVPFPFPHAQITSLFVLVVVGLMPVLMLTYVTNEIFGIVLNFLTVMCFAGLHEVARELENPFQNVPNDIPLNNFQAQFNESLMNMFTGYHPDAYWEVTQDVEPPTSSQLDALEEFRGKVQTAKEKVSQHGNGNKSTTARVSPKSSMRDDNNPEGDEFPIGVDNPVRANLEGNDSKERDQRPREIVQEDG
jgi:predicted membrane chloride channel (bestrophin family)